MENNNPGKEWLILVVVIFAIAFAFQGSRGLWEPDEGRYVRCAYEMQKTGNWIMPTRNYQPHVTKPPVTYWLIGAGISLFGRNEWGARAFHGLAFALTALLVGLLGKRMWDDRTGMLAGLVYATTFLPFLAGNATTTDTILTFFTTLAVACFWMSVTSRAETAKSSLWALAMWFFFGVAFMTKGPAGLLPLAAIIAYLLILKSRKRLPAIVTISGIILLVITSVWWFLAVARQHEGLLSYFLGHEVVGRIVTGEHRRNPGWLGPFKVYLPMLIFGALPWACFWPVLVFRLRPGLSSLAWWKNLRERPTALFLALWFAVPLVILSLASSRLPLYVLPLFAPLALVTARGLIVQYPEKASRAVRFRGTPGFAVAVVVLCLVGSKLVAAHYPWKRDGGAMWKGIQETLKEKLGDKRYEIVLSGENFDSLAFYSDSNVELTGSRQSGTPTFMPTELLSEEFDELSQSRYTHVFLLREKHVDRVRSELDKRKIRYSVAEAPFNHTLIFCESPLDASRTVRLAFVGDTPIGGSAQATLGNALYHIDQNRSLNGVVLLGDMDAGRDGRSRITSADEKRFRKSFAPLLDNGLSFYAIPDDDNYRHDEKDRFAHLPLLNDDGKHYYKKMFGENLVEVFFVDSTTIKEDGGQVDWLNEALRKSEARWKVVAMHHPLYSDAQQAPCDPSLTHLLEPVFVENKVDFVISDHNPVYERPAPIEGIRYITIGSSDKARSEDNIPAVLSEIVRPDQDEVILVLHFDTKQFQLSTYARNRQIIDRDEAARGPSPQRDDMARLKN